MRIRGRVKNFVVVLLLLFVARETSGQILADVLDEFTAIEYASESISGKKALKVYRTDLFPQTINGAAVEFGTLDEDASAFFRFRTNGDWGDWKQAVIIFSATGGTAIAGYRNSKGFASDGFEFRLETREGEMAVVRNGGVFSNENDADQLPAPDQLPFTGQQSGDIIPPRLITRAEWNARPFQLGSPVNLASSSYKYITWHHAAGYSADTEEEGKAQMRAMQALHQNIRGWSDIGYQFAIDRGGRLYQGRPFMDNSTSLSQVPVLARGAHVGGANSGNIGTVIMGCYHPPEGSHCEQEITPAAYNTYVTLFSFLSERYGVSPTLIRGHRDFSSTACPGNNNYALIPGLISDVTSLLQTGNEPLGEADLAVGVQQNQQVDISWSITDNFGIETLVLEKISSKGTETVVDDALTVSSWTDASLAGETAVIYLLIASHSDGRKQELARMELDIDSPSSYLLASAFPNPAVSMANFKYFLSVEGLVSIALYDPSGRLLEEWNQGFLDADAWYSVKTDVSHLASGLYFFRIQVEGFSDTVFDKTQAFHVVN